MKCGYQTGASLGAVVTLVLISGCTSVPVAVAPQFKETLQVLSADMQLLTVSASAPGNVLLRKAVTGLGAGETLVGMDYRISRGVLFALSSAGRVYTLDGTTGALKPVGAAPAVALQGDAFGVDFNPVADRIRVVSSTGQNLRLHPDTGALAASDPAPVYAPGDVNAGKSPELVAAAYTYNKTDDKLTTNYAIDRKAGTLVRQGSREGVQPVVSPNTGLLFTVGSLGVGQLDDASMDIADVSGNAFAVLRAKGQSATRLYTIDLTTGNARLIGTLADGKPMLGLAIEP